MGLVPEEPGLGEVIAGQRELLARLRAVVEAKDAENALLRVGLDAGRERERRLGLPGGRTAVPGCGQMPAASAVTLGRAS